MNPDNKIVRPFTIGVALALATLIIQPSTVFSQGNLTPPGAPAPTMKSLDQVEPRVPILSLPFHITNSGSYYLASNLVGAAFQDGIVIQVNNVTLDLNGFTLRGVASSGSGVLVNGSYTNLAIVNGRISDWGSYGVDDYSLGFPRNVLIERITVSNCGSGGIIAEDQSIIRDSVCIGNRFYGVYLVGGLITGVIAMTNSGNGIYIEGNAVVEQCRSFRNGQNGIAGASDSMVRDCVANNNSDTGLSVSLRCLVTGCVANGNKHTGISTLSDSVVKDNLVNGNGSGLSDAGIRTAGSGSRVEGNQVRNTSGTGIATTGNDLVIRNTVGNASNATYSPSTGPNIGPIEPANGVTSPASNIYYN